MPWWRGGTAWRPRSGCDQGRTLNEWGWGRGRQQQSSSSGPACRAPSGQPGVSTLEALGSRVSWDSRQAGTQPGAKTHPLQETGAPPCGAGEHEGLHVGCMPSPHPPPVRAPSPRAHPKAWSSPCRPTRYSPMSVVSSRNFRNPGSHSPPRLRAVGAPGPEPGGPRGPRRSSPHPRMAY